MNFSWTRTCRQPSGFHAAVACLTTFTSVQWHLQVQLWLPCGMQSGLPLAPHALLLDPLCNCSWTQMQWISGYGNLAGAVWFEVSALAMLLEQGNPQHP